MSAHTLRYINEYDSFSTLDILFTRYMDSGVVDIDKEAFQDYLKTVTRRDHGLRIIRSMPNDFMSLCKKTSDRHLTLLYLTSPDSYGVYGLSSRSIDEACVPEKFASGSYDKTKANKEHVYRSSWSIASRVKLSPGFPSRVKISSTPYYHYNFSSNPSVSLDIVLGTPEIQWVWPRLAANPGIDPVLLFYGYRHKPWAMNNLSQNPRVTADLVNSNPDEEWDVDCLAIYMDYKEAMKVSVPRLDIVGHRKFGINANVPPELFAQNYEKWNVDGKTTSIIMPSNEIFIKRLESPNYIPPIVYTLFGIHMVPLNQLMRSPTFTFESMDAFGPEKTTKWSDFSKNTFDYQDRLNYVHFLENAGIPSDLTNCIVNYMITPVFEQSQHGF